MIHFCCVSGQPHAGTIMGTKARRCLTVPAAPETGCCRRRQHSPCSATACQFIYGRDRLGERPTKHALILSGSARASLVLLTMSWTALT